MSSAAGPSFVGKCSLEMQKFCIDPDVTWKEVALYQWVVKLASSASQSNHQGGGEVDQAVPAHCWKRAGREEIWIAPSCWAWRTFRGQLGRVRRSLLLKDSTLFVTSCVNVNAKVWACQGGCQLLLAWIGKKVQKWSWKIIEFFFCLKLLFKISFLKGLKFLL